MSFMNDVSVGSAFPELSLRLTAPHTTEPAHTREDECSHITISQSEVIGTAMLTLRTALRFLIKTALAIMNLKLSAGR